MNTTRYVIVMIAVVLTSATAESRVIRYNGPASGRDYATDVAVGPDGSIYVAGASTGTGTGLDFTVLCYSPEESLRWAYRWNRSGSSDDVARAVAVGPDGNIYAAGFTVNPVPYYDVAVLSLTPDGNLRWAVVHAGEGGYEDSASAIAVDADNNVYTAGVGDDIFGENTEFTVLSFEPDTGGLRWVYVASADYIDEATDVAVGPDSTVFASGVLWSGASRSAFAVAAVNTGDGSQRWLSRFTHGEDDSRAAAVACRDNRLYAAGHTGGSFNDFTVVAHDPDSGDRQWTWYYNPATNLSDKALDVAVGPDGSAYACGRSVDTTVTQRFTVARVAPDGSARWVYTDTTGPQGQFEEARELAVAEDGRVYAAGWRDTGWPFDGDEAVVQCLDSAGVLQWVYRYDNIRDSVDLVEAIALGNNGRVYAVGSSFENGSEVDMLLLCLDAVPPGVEESHKPRVAGYKQEPTFVRGVLMLSQAASPRPQAASLLDIAGRKILDLHPGENDVSRLAPGLYFMCSDHPGSRYPAVRRRVVKVR
jgi:uncharacterized delta-60 repeat protein